MLTVAAIPVAMATILSVTMAVGARLLAKKQAVVRRQLAEQVRASDRSSRTARGIAGK